MASDNPTPTVRPRPEEVDGGLPAFSEFRSNIRSISWLLLIAGAGSSLAGAIVWLFIRDLAGTGLLIMAVGGALLLADIAVAWRQVGRAVFGRRGRYGVNAVVIVIAFVAIAVVINFFLFWLGNRPNPMGWLRVDTTSTKQFNLSQHSVGVLGGLSDEIIAHAFFVFAFLNGFEPVKDRTTYMTQSFFAFHILDIAPSEGFARWTVEDRSVLAVGFSCVFCALGIEIFKSFEKHKVSNLLNRRQRIGDTA